MIRSKKVQKMAISIGVIHKQRWLIFMIFPAPHLLIKSFITSSLLIYYFNQLLTYIPLFPIKLTSIMDSPIDEMTLCTGKYEDSF